MIVSSYLGPFASGWAAAVVYCASGREEEEEGRRCGREEAAEARKWAVVMVKCKLSDHLELHTCN